MNSRTSMYWYSPVHSHIHMEIMMNTDEHTHKVSIEYALRCGSCLDPKRDNGRWMDSFHLWGNIKCVPHWTPSCRYLYCRLVTGVSLLLVSAVPVSMSVGNGKTSILRTLTMNSEAMSLSSLEMTVSITVSTIMFTLSTCWATPTSRLRSGSSSSSICQSRMNK
jgi:hypothetical protein